MQTLILNPIDPLILIGVGILIISSEAIIASFILIWFGLGSVIIGVVSYFYGYEDGIWQIAHASIISVFLLLVLRGKLTKKLLNSKDSAPDENFLNTKGTGTIKNGKLYYKSIFWTIENTEILKDLKDGETVDILEALKGKAKVKKIL